MSKILNKLSSDDCLWCVSSSSKTISVVTNGNSRIKREQSLSIYVILAIIIFTSMVLPISQQTSINLDKKSRFEIGVPPLPPAAGAEFESSSMLQKRASGFLPMRGRKSSEQLSSDLEDSIPFEGGLGAVSPDNSAIMDIATMGSGPNIDELELMELLEKRNRINSFMPMRGRKSMMGYYPNDQINHLLPPAAAARLNYYSKGSGGSALSSLPLQQQKALSQFFHSSTGSNSGRGESSFHQNEQKRGKGLSFFGTRGKRSI